MPNIHPVPKANTSWPEEAKLRLPDPGHNFLRDGEPKTYLHAPWKMHTHGSISTAVTCSSECSSHDGAWNFGRNLYC